MVQPIIIRSNTWCAWRAIFPPSSPAFIKNLPQPRGCCVRKPSIRAVCNRPKQPEITRREHDQPRAPY